MNQILVYQIIVLLIISVLSAVFAGVDGLLFSPVFYRSFTFKIFQAQPFVSW